MMSHQTADRGLAQGRGASRHETRPGAAVRPLNASVLSLVALFALGGCATDPGVEQRVFDAEPRTVSAPAAPVAQRPDDLPSPPAVGSVRLIEGAFTDVLELTSADLRAGRTPVIEAELGNPVDAAPLLHLEIRALFYDRTGDYLGEATYIERGHGEDDHAGEKQEGAHDDEPYDSLPLTLTTDGPLPGEAVSATLHVIHFVTE